MRILGLLMIAVGTGLGTAPKTAHADGPPLVASEAVARGAVVYRTVCMRCHAADPMNDRPGTAARVGNGVLGAIEAIPQMRGLRQRLSNGDIADVQAWLDYVVLPRDAIRPDTGWYWDPTRPWRAGFFEYNSGDAFWVTLYFAPGGVPEWTLTRARYTGSPAAIKASFQRFALPAGSTPVAASGAPAARLQLETRRDVTLEVDALTAPMTRMGFAGATPIGTQPGYPETGFYVPVDGGGVVGAIALEVQATSLYVGAYGFDAAGQATWHTAFAPMASATAFSGRWSRWRDGPALWPAVSKNPSSPHASKEDAGPAEITFETPRRGRVRLPDGREITFQRLQP